MKYRNSKILENGWIDCEIEHPIYGWIPFTCSPDDTGAEFDVKKLHATMKKDKKTRPYTPPTQEELDKIASRRVKEIRDLKLQTEVDPVVMNSLRWNDLNQEQQNLWTNYRRALLDITLQKGYPHNIVWPEKPN